MPRPAQYQWDADAAFPQCALPVAERRVARQPFSTVVVRKDDERVPGQTASIQLSENLSDAHVSALEHANVIATCGRCARDGVLIQSQIGHWCGWPRRTMTRGGGQAGNVEGPV